MPRKTILISYIDEFGEHGKGKRAKCNSGHYSSKMRRILNALSPREREVAELIAEGYNKSEAARLLKVSRWRVRRCLDRIRGKVEKMKLAA
jgi:DNA-binding NarL/FixJ family response regulator